MLEESLALAPFYTPEWVAGQQGEPGQALLNIYLHLQEQIIRRLNRVPDKNFVAFLDMMGMKLLAAQSAQVAATFTLATGTTEHVLVPKGTLLSGAAADGSGEVIFQTQKDQLITPANLQAIFSYDAAEDSIHEHTQGEKEPTPFIVFEGLNKQERSLYLGHEDLLNMEKPATISVDFALSRTAGEGGNLSLVWEYFDGARWVLITRFERDPKTGDLKPEDGTRLFTRSGRMDLKKEHTGEIGEAEIGGIKSRWIRCRLGISLSGADTIRLPEINTVGISVKPLSPFAPDLLFNNDVPINLEGFRLRMLAMGSTFRFAEHSPDPPPPVVQAGDVTENVINVINPGGALVVGDFLKLDNTFDSVEIREVQKIEGQEIERKKVTLNERLSYEYVDADLKFTLDSPDDAENVVIHVSHLPNALVKGDLLKLDNKTDPAELVEVRNVEGEKITLSKPLNSKYTASSEITFQKPSKLTLHTALRPTGNMIKVGSLNPALGPEGRPVDDKPFAGLELEAGSKVTLYHRGQKVFAKLAEPPRDNNTLTLSDRDTSPFYIEGDLVEIAPKILPFGKLPLVFDSFYIASDEAFSKKGATIKLNIDAALFDPPVPPDPPDKNVSAVLSWEYWNGKSWRGIRVGDTTQRFSGPGNVIFTCPDDIEKVEVNGEEKFWIRVRIVDGDYGKEILIVPKGNGSQEVEVKPGKVHYPIISSLTIEYENTGEKPRQCLTFNNLNLEDHTADSIDLRRTFAPFTPMPEKFSSLFLGFDKPLIGGLLSILFNVKEQSVDQDEPLKMLWFYWNGSEWAPLNVLDETKHLTKIGLLEFVIGRDFALKKLFGKEQFWLKGSVVEGEHPGPLEVKSLHPNTTFVLQADVANDEIAGSSNGTADQEFALQHPLVISQQVFVREPILPTEEEREAILKEEGEDAINEKKNELGETIEIVVRWHEVEDFDRSDSKSRHYVIDRRLGRIKFGDGTRGMVPPVGADNIRVSYRFGGGKKGNVPAKAISGLKSAVPFVSAVTNHLAGDGGSETEKLDDVLVRAPLLLKNRDRAVMPEDFEALARGASRKVARAKCLPHTDTEREVAPGWVTVMIVPDSDEARPQPSQQLIKIVTEGLEKQSANVVSWPGHVNVTGPDYVEVIVEATVVPTSPDQAAAVETAATEGLNRYIHPLTGGPEGTGWPFGQDICLSDIIALIERIESVDYVEKVVLRVKNETHEENVPVDEYTLPVSGEHQITISLGSPEPGFDRCGSSRTECADRQEFKRVNCKKG